MMSFTEVFLLLFGATSFFFHYVQLINIKRLESKVKKLENQPMHIEIMEYDEEAWR